MRWLLFFIVMMGASALATPISIQKLLSFADQNGYRDNRAHLQHDKMYSGSKNCCENGAYSTLEAFGGVDQYKQVALTCLDCGETVVTPAQVRLCDSEVSLLTKALDDQTLRIRRSSRPHKCENGSGMALRFDFFAR